MITNYKTKNLLSAVLILLLTISFSSCEKYIDAGSPSDKLTEDKVFVDEATTLSSVLSMYSSYNTRTLIFNINRYGAMSADDGYYFNNASYDIFRTNTIPGDANWTNVVYNYPYSVIYYANYNLEGLESSTNLSANFKNQMIGECKFWRAFCYYNLVNYFGEVPLVTNTNALENGKLPRSSVEEVYNQIVEDLLDAKEKLESSYSSYNITEKARIDKYTVEALLAKVYLYREQWVEAEAAAGAVITSGKYQLETNLNNVFINTSTETIWQNAVKYNSSASGVTQMGVAWIPSGSTPTFVLYDALVNTFEANDLRKTNWTKTITYSAKTYYYPYKYKIRLTSAAGNEYNVMFRLAEQYLIRAEARAKQGKITGAESAAADLNVIRNRAGLGNTNATDETTMLLAIEKENWVELFTEMSNRWFNLKRTGRIDLVFNQEDEKKGTWQSYQALYPIPQSELVANPNLLPNNHGY